MSTTPAIETDAVVIGAGPVGLFQVFELGLLEVKAHVVDSLPAPGGQCVELYGDKPIYDIPGLPYCSGRELCERLMKQIEPFGAPIHLGEEVGTVQRRDDGRFFVQTDRGTSWIAKVVVIAGGVGSFQPKRLKLDGLQRFEGRQLRHHAQGLDAMAGKRVVILGDDDMALDAALVLAERASVTLVHRRDAFRATPDRIGRLQAAREAGRIRFIAGQPTAWRADGETLIELDITRADDGVEVVPLDHLLVLLGLSPRLGPIADWGLELQRRQLVVDTEKFQTREPGIFAVGDINTYPGKRKLIVCGFHEATLAAFAAAAHVFPERPVQLQYTTTSPRLHELLGVVPGA